MRSVACGSRREKCEYNNLFVTRTRPDIITHAEHRNARPPSIEHVNRTIARADKHRNYTKRSLRGVIHPSTYGSGTHTAGSTRNTRRRKPEHINCARNRAQPRPDPSPSRSGAAVSAIDQPLTPRTARMRSCQRWEAARRMRGAKVAALQRAACGHDATSTAPKPATAVAAALTTSAPAAMGKESGRCSRYEAHGSSKKRVERVLSEAGRAEYTRVPCPRV